MSGRATPGTADQRGVTEDSKGLWVPTRGQQHQTPSNQWYFIDENRAYRGPVSKQTLHYLFSTHAISRNTYVFTENLSNNREWIRIRKLPDLHEELQQPLRVHTTPDGSATTLSDIATGGGPSASKRPPGSAATPASARGAAGAPGAATSTDSRGRNRVMPSNAAAAQPARTSAELDRQAPLAADAPIVATSRMDINLHPANLAALGSNGAGGSSSTKLSELILNAQSPTRKAAAANAAGGKFSLRSLMRGTPKYKFGLPLEVVRFDDEGVPEILSALRTLLWEQNGHLIEGIFRVPPSASALKVAKQNAENGALDKITDMESVAQLIKLWFRELPESIFGDCLVPIVDGPPSDPAECDRLIQQLPEANRNTIYFLLKLITDICRYESENRMTAQSMTIVLAPNLVLAPDTLGPLQALELNTRVVQFTELLFQHWNSTSRQHAS